MDNYRKIEYEYKAATDSLKRIYDYSKSILEQSENNRDILTNGKIMEVAPYPWNKTHINVRSCKNPDEANDKIEILYNESKIIRESNKAALENNTKVFKATVDLLKSLGLKEEVYFYKTSRSKERTNKRSEWLLELGNVIKRDDGWEKIERAYQEHKNQIQKWREEIQNIKDKKDKEQKDLERKQIIERTLAVLAIKYGCDLQADVYDILDVILNKNKYLRLAHYLMMNRNDWNDGCSYAEEGLSKFVIESDIDREISEEIFSYIDNWEGDGRVFRDSVCGYDYLFGLVKDEDLKKDYDKIYEFVNE